MNTLLDFSGDDQAALLDVIQDYFCDPDPLQEEEEDENPEDTLNLEDAEQATLELEGTLIKRNHKHKQSKILNYYSHKS